MKNRLSEGTEHCRTNRKLLMQYSSHFKYREQGIRNTSPLVLYFLRTFVPIELSLEGTDPGFHSNMVSLIDCIFIHICT